MELKPCPFCGAGETVSEADSKHWSGIQWNILSWHVRHWCAYEHHGRPMLNVKGRTQEEAETRWNTRSQSDAGSQRN
jgi:hypothetical protein